MGVVADAVQEERQRFVRAIEELIGRRISDSGVYLNDVVGAIEAWNRRELEEQKRKLTILPTADEIYEMDAEQASEWIRLLQHRKTQLENRMKEIGSKELWILSIHPGKNIEVVRSIREITGLGLRESKTILDLVLHGMPQRVIDTCPESNATAKYLGTIAQIEWR